jgi:hypothetical protein
MVDGLHPQLSIVRQCALFQIRRSGQQSCVGPSRVPGRGNLRYANLQTMDQ